METIIRLTLLFLNVLSCVRCADITVQGHEGGNAVINCPSEEGYKSFPKYLLKGEYKDNVEVIRSNGGAEWTYSGRFSLQDKDRNIFTVTIQKLTQEDAGMYGCGVNTWGTDYYKTVKLTVVSKKPTKPTVATPKISIVTLPHTTVATHNATSAPQLNITESERTTHFQSDPTTASSAGHVANLSGGLGAAVVLFALLLVAFILMKSRTKRKGGSLSNLAGTIRPGSGVYSEILHTPLNPSDERHNSAALTSIYAMATSTASAQHIARASESKQHPQHNPASMQAANHLPQPNIAGNDTYCLATHPTPALHSRLTSAANQHLDTATAATGIYSLATNPTQSLHEPASPATNLQPDSDPSIYGNLVSANENPDGCEYATVVFCDGPIDCDSASTVRFSKCSIEEQPIYSGIV